MGVLVSPVGPGWRAVGQKLLVVFPGINGVIFFTGGAKEVQVSDLNVHLGKFG